MLANKNISFIFLAAVFCLVVLTCPAFAAEKNNTATLNASGQLLIPQAELNAKPGFFRFKVADTTMEIIALQNKNGETRLAFNTCQVCQGSPQAYFIQKGKYLECQNCKSKFEAATVGGQKGGCNPMPITAEYYALQGDNVVVDAEFLNQNSDRFKNWRR